MPKIPAMDFATIIGLLLAWGAVVYSMFHASHGALGAYIKPSEIFLVFGGSLGARSINTIYTWDARCRKELLELMGGSWEKRS